MDKEDIHRHLNDIGYIMPSFNTYGSQTGLQDYGPYGVKLKRKIIDTFRNIFLKDSEIMEIDTPQVVPQIVFQKSGHVDRFTDPIVKTSDGTFRADHLVKTIMAEKGDTGKLSEVDNMTNDELEAYINGNIELDIDCDGIKEEVYVKDKVLMHQLKTNEYLRPELAQNLILNTQRMMQKLRRSLPFGLAQIGKAYRNEINPKPFTRLIEFTLAEIEYLYDPCDKSICDSNGLNEQLVARFVNKDDINEMVTFVTMTEKGYIKNKHMTRFMGKIYRFVLDIGIHPERIQFRQHKSNELAHYAIDCWDLEIDIGNGKDRDWLEVIGCADRQSYDLACHEIEFQRQLEEPVTEIKKVVKVNKKNIGKTFGEYAQYIIQSLEGLSQKKLGRLEEHKWMEIPLMDKIFKIDNTMFEIVEKKTKRTIEEFRPHVIEPSFGIDRLIYAVLSTNCWKRADSRKIVLSLKPSFAPYDIALIQISNDEAVLEYLRKLMGELDKYGIRIYTDFSSTAIGKRYVRVDQIGIKYCVTIDFNTVKNDILWARDRDTTMQITFENTDYSIKALANNVNVDTIKELQQKIDVNFHVEDKKKANHKISL
jgi:glycyl-tRNA synthetase